MNPTHTTAAGLAMLAALGLTLAGCGESGSGGGHAHGPDTHEHAPAPQQAAGAGGTHVHADGSTHDDHGNEDHAHDEEVPLAPATIGDMTVELAQGRGSVEAGKEMHLVVKLPYNDNGATVVRAWIGTNDRTLSFVGKGEYATSHDDYDIHATAPAPLPANPMWWIEIERPNGTKAVGSATPIIE